MNQNYKKYPSEKIYPYSQIDKNKNIFILLQKIGAKKIKSNIKLKRLNSISSKDSKPHIRKNIKLIKSIEKKRSNSIDMILYTPIKQQDFSINTYKINEECKNKISNIFKEYKNEIITRRNELESLGIPLRNNKSQTYTVPIFKNYILVIIITCG